MSKEDYEKAYKAGKKEYQNRMMRGEMPTLKVLEDILPPKGEYSEMPLGLIEIPVAQIVGTRNGGRSNAFAANFMPILKSGTEFADKWGNLATSHEQDGIREPIKAYEYMNEFFVEEGNKRVSVLKYFDAVFVHGNVIRILPKKTNEKKNRLYYEYVDFYNLSKINYIWFSKLGSAHKLQKLVGKTEQEIWNDDDRMNFKSVYSNFQDEYEAHVKNQLLTTGDAFLAFVELYGYQKLSALPVTDLIALMRKGHEEFYRMNQSQEVDLKLDPTPVKKTLLKRILPVGGTSGKLKIGFIYEKTPGTSAWTYLHELGRLHLEQRFPEEVETVYYEGVTSDTIADTITRAIQEKCDIVFTTTPAFAAESVKAAIEYPKVRILNCSLNTSHRYARMYYSRMHEAKFLMGAIAGALCENDKVAYLADYPIYGTIANINAFALGVKMINPRAKVYLEWTSVKNQNVAEKLRNTGASCISGLDMVIPEAASRNFGLYQVLEDRTKSLAIPLWQWGKFYEQLVRTIMERNWENDDNSEMKAINYWWGMSAGVIDVVLSAHVPTGTKRLLMLLKNAISSGEFLVFSGEFYDQTGAIHGKSDQSFTPEEVVTMDWLVDNIIGSIPKKEDLTEHAKPVIQQQGVIDKEGLSDK